MIVPLPSRAALPFDLSYRGLEAGRHAFRMDFRALSAREAHDLRQKVHAWIFAQADEDVTCANTGEAGVFVITFPSLTDMEAFEAAFPVRGFSPTLVA